MGHVRLESDGAKRSSGKGPDGGPNPTDVYVGERVRSRRMELGLTQTELGRAIGLTLQQVQKYERGTNRVCSSRLFDLSRALHVPVSYFFDGLGLDGQDEAARSGAVRWSDEQAMMQETRDLVRAYYGISDPRLRSQVWALAVALAPSA